MIMSTVSCMQNFRGFIRFIMNYSAINNLIVIIIVLVVGILLPLRGKRLVMD